MPMMCRFRHALVPMLTLIGLTACASDSPPGVVFQATQPIVIAAAPVYTITPTRTPRPTETIAPTPTPSLTPSTPPTETPPTETPTLTRTPTLVLSPSAEATVTGDASLVTPAPLITLTPPLPLGAPAARVLAAVIESTPEGWSCGDFPCADDSAAWLERIRVPDGFAVESIGRFPGQVQQIAYGRDGRLYATVLEEGARSGAVHVMDADGITRRYSEALIAPLGLAFQPGTDDLFVSGRMTAQSGGGVWRVAPGGGAPIAVLTDLPCCLSLIDNQPNGMIFGRDGYLYLGIGSSYDTTASPPRILPPFQTLAPYEAAVVRIQPHTGEIAVYAQGVRNAYDLALDSLGRLYASDQGLLAGGIGDRVLRLSPGGHYGFPFWGGRGCTVCPIRTAGLDVQSDLLTLTAGTMPRGIVVYTGTQFPVNLYDTLFVTLWNAVEGGQRIIQIDPRRVNESGYQPTAFVTGLIRPTDLAIAPDGTLTVADQVYGQIWRVRYAP